MTRASPFHCPYCADEDLRPHGEQHGEWECRACLRAFRLGFIGHLSPANINDQSEPSNPEAPSGRRTAS